MTLLVQLPERVASKIQVDPSGCWLWTASVDPSGYGRVRWGRPAKPGGTWPRAYAHRLVYHLIADQEFPVYPGWGFKSGPAAHIDHLCRVKHCVNPAHLEPVTSAENQRRYRATLAESQAS